VHRLRKGRSRGPTLNARGASIALVAAGLVVALDQLSKAWVLRHVAPGPHHLFGPLGVELGRNSGVAFSLIAGHSAVAFWLSLVLLVAVGVCSASALPIAPAIIFGLLLGGGLSNEIDRVARRHSGGVVDFVTLPHFATFNLADTAITFGVIGLLVLLVLRRPVLSHTAGR
jgi:signal peptidase II